jgi:hypothetical protein
LRLRKPPLCRRGVATISPDSLIALVVLRALTSPIAHRRGLNPRSDLLTGNASRGWRRRERFARWLSHKHGVIPAGYGDRSVARTCLLVLVSCGHREDRSLQRARGCAPPARAWLPRRLTDRRAPPMSSAPSVIGATASRSGAAELLGLVDGQLHPAGAVQGAWRRPHEHAGSPRKSASVFSQVVLLGYGARAFLAEPAHPWLRGLGAQLFWNTPNRYTTVANF